MADRRSTICWIAEITNFSFGKYSGSKKLSARWVPQMLTVYQKRFALYFEASLVKFKTDLDKSLFRFVTVVESSLLISSCFKTK